MFLFVIFCLLVLVGIAGAVASFFIKEGRGTVLGSSVAVLLLLALPVFLLDTLTQVDTKNVGVVTTFGRPTGYLDNGLHFVAPWSSVTEISDAVQTDTYASDGYDGAKQGGAAGTCVHVRLAGQATACLNVSVRWQIKPSGVDYLFRNFKDNGAITDNLILRDLQQATNIAFATYNPLNIDQNGDSTNPPLTDISKRVQQMVQDDIDRNNSGSIDVGSVIIPIINYDPQTQARINEVLAQIALTKKAIQAKQTAIEQAAANDALSKSVNHDPGVLVAQCLTLTQNAIDKGATLPAGWSCFGSLSTSLAVPTK